MTQANATRRVLLVLSQHQDMAGKPTGTYLPELAHAYEVFDAADYEVDFVSPGGGAIALYGGEDDAASVALREDRATMARIHASHSPDAVDPARYAAIYFVGGHGTMWDFPDNPGLGRIAEQVFAAGGVVSAVCHGPAGLVGLRGPNARPLVEGYRVAAFTDAEEAAVGHGDDVPFLLESRLRDLGADVVTASNWKENVVVDRNLVTGQNPASARGVAAAVVERLASISRAPA